MSLLRRRIIHPFIESNESSKPQQKQDDHDDHGGGKLRPRPPPKWSCLDTWCWLFGCICVTWWFLSFLYNAMPASFPKYVAEVISGPSPDPPGVRLRKQGLKAKHPVVFVPAALTGGLELWEGKQCAQGLFRKRVWGGGFSEVYKRFKRIMRVIQGSLIVASTIQRKPREQLKEGRNMVYSPNVIFDTVVLFIGFLSLIYPKSSYIGRTNLKMRKEEIQVIL